MSIDLTPAQKQQLLQLAWDAIDHGLQTGRVLKPATDDPVLQCPGASFVTLNLHGELRGCIGSLQAYQPLADDVAQNAFNAAFRDPRFAPLDDSERDALDLHISILSPSTPIHFTSEADLLRQLRPGIDGLILQDGHHRGTFLPQVWESLADPVDFLAHLKRKAGLPSHYWSPTLQVQRYTVDSIP